MGGIGRVFIGCNEGGGGRRPPSNWPAKVNEKERGEGGKKPATKVKRQGHSVRTWPLAHRKLGEVLSPDSICKARGMVKVTL